jgi:hypothetical protein
MGAVLTGLMTGLLLLVAAGILRMDAPHLGLLWLLAWLCAASVAAGTIVLFAVLGSSVGQLLAMVLFVYAGLPVAGRRRAAAGAARRPAVACRDRAAAPDPRRNPGDLVLRAQADAGLARAVAAAALGWSSGSSSARSR